MNEATAILIGGTIIVPLLQILKRAFHLKGNAMRWVACGSSVAVAAGAMLWQGVALLGDPELLIQAALGVLGVSQLIYGAIKSKMNLSEGK